MLSENKVIVAMSGGVDSSVAASLLKREGYEVFGVSMELYTCDRPLANGCCTPKDRLDARKVCELLDIPHAIIDLRKPFKTNVLEYFAKEYARGRTPLPCAPCNKDVRFKALLDTANAKGVFWIATGHYARIVKEEESDAVCLYRAKDLKKDQSYFLWGLEPEMIRRLKLPIGDYTKEEVRKIAREFNLPVSEKQDSQDLCFVGEEDHARFLEEHFPESAAPQGNFVDEEGRYLGKHQGIHAYTLGQRKGLGVSLGERRYVLRLDAAKNEVVLGSRESLKAKGLVAKNPNWISRESWVMSHESWVKIRSTHSGVSAQLEEAGPDLKIIFDRPQEAVTPGQAAVFYQNEKLLGGAWIERALS